jgi:uncharacterized protein (TIGR02466 family)
MDKKNLKTMFSVDMYETEWENFDSKSALDIIMPYFTSHRNDNEFYAADGSPLIVRTENHDLQYQSEFKIIVEFIEKHVQEYWKMLGYTKKIDPYIINMWANEIPPGGFTPSHHHSPVPIAGVLYLDADPTQGNLYMEDPLWPIKTLTPRDYTVIPLMSLLELEAKTGKMYLFPGWIQHHTKTNRSQENRYVIAFTAGAHLDFKPKPY